MPDLRWRFLPPRETGGTAPAEAAKHDRPRRTARKLNDFGRTLTMLARMVVVPLPTWVILTVLSLSVFAGAASWYCLRSRPDKEE
ncbi:MAG: hypothetical protein IIB58_10850 [Planctomycetes bacterium]|nr:hypothetical protein [Planctomycetota bacterium]